MPVTPDHEPQAVASPQPAACRIALGFDFGRIRIGVAVGEAITGLARPLRILTTRQKHPDWDAIARLIAEWQPDWLVVGVPRHADDSASATTAAALRFVRQLQQRFPLPIATIDERLSSWEAEQRGYQANTGRRRQHDTALDARAAAVILESWFNQQRSLTSWVTPNS